MVPNESTCLYYLQQNSQARHKYWVLHTHLKQIPRCPNREWNFIKICRKKMTVGMWIDCIQPMLYGSFTSQKVNALIQLIYIQRDLGDFLLSNDSWYCIFLFFHRHREQKCVILFGPKFFPGQSLPWMWDPVVRLYWVCTIFFGMLSSLCLQ